MTSDRWIQTYKRETYTLVTRFFARGIVVTRHVNGDGWWMSAWEAGVELKQLEAAELEDAKAEALAFLKKRLSGCFEI